jgi:hypothetical protein
VATEEKLKINALRHRKKHLLTYEIEDTHWGQFASYTYVHTCFGHVFFTNISRVNFSIMTPVFHTNF